MAKGIKMYGHTDSVSGMTLLDDGRWCLWSEGYGDIDIITTDEDGCLSKVEAAAPHTSLYNEIAEALEDPAEEEHEMDDAMAILYDVVRNRKNI